MAMKQNNFYLRWQKAAGAAKSETRSREMQALIPALPLWPWPCWAGAA